MFKGKRLILMAVLVLVLCLLTIQVKPSLAAENDLGSTINVQGTGYAFVTPDRVKITLGVVTVAETIQEAQKINADKVSKFIDDLIKKGVPKKDIQTLSYHIWPEYNYREEEKGKLPKIIGYRVENVLAVVLKDVNQAGSVIDAAVENGVNQVQSIEFFAEDTSSYKVKALKAAVQDAQVKAEAVAEALGKKITGIESVTVEDTGSSVFVRKGMALEAGGPPPPIATPIEPGEFKVRASVTVVYRIE